MLTRFPGLTLWSTALCALLAAASATAQVPLHQRIDQEIAAGKADFEKTAAPLADDAEFLRRLYLDLTGSIPTAADARAFLKDTASDRRVRLIDKLLASPEHPRHLAHVFDVMLMERRPGKNVPQPQWHEYLRSSFAEKKPYDQLVREILSSDGSDPKTRPAARFFLDRDGEPHLITKDISRLFLGMNLHCAQCHDHPLVEDYKQDFYYGVFAFVSRSYLFTDKAKKMSVLAEKGEGEVTFQSVFKPKLTKTTGPRLPGLPPIKEPMIEKGKEYVVAPAKEVRPVPRFSRRGELAKAITSPDNVRFRKNTANRLWALMLGRGIIDPVDLDHGENPPSHPKLLDMLGEELHQMKYDLRAFLREIALSKTYQRSSQLPAGLKDPPEARTFAQAQLRPLSPEQLALALMQATGHTDAERLALGKNLSEATLYAKLGPSIAPFVQLFGSQPGDPAELGFQATLDQTLFLRNGALLRGWLTPRNGNLTYRLGQLKEADAIAEELYLSVLTRFPNAEERQEIASFLGNQSDRTAAIQELVWALMTSAEFRFNH